MSNSISNISVQNQPSRKRSESKVPSIKIFSNSESLSNLSSSAEDYKMMNPNLLRPISRQKSKGKLKFMTFRDRLERLASNPENFMSEFMALHRDIGNPSYKSLLSSYDSSPKNKLKFSFHIVKLHDIYSDETYYFRIDKKGIYFYDEYDDDELVYIYKTLNPSLLKTLYTSGNAACSSKISKQYILDAFNDNSFCVLSFGHHKRKTRSLKSTDITKNDLLGFVCAKADEDNKAKRKASSKFKPINNSYITVICSNKSFGLVLLNFIENLCEFLGFKNMKLNAVPEAVTFYLKKGGYEIQINKQTKKSKTSFVYKLSKRLPEPIPGSFPILRKKQGDDFIDYSNKVPLYSKKTKKVTIKPQKGKRKSQRLRQLIDTKVKAYIIPDVIHYDGDILMMKPLKQMGINK